MKSYYYYYISQHFHPSTCPRINIIHITDYTPPPQTLSHFRYLQLILLPIYFHLSIKDECVRVN